MYRIALALVLPLSAPLLVAQSGQPPTHSSTVEPFQMTHYLGSPSPLPAGYRGSLLLFDLAVDSDVSISQIDVRLDDDGADNWGPPPGMTGQTTTVSVYTVPAPWVAVPGSPWTLAATGTLTVADRLSHSPVAFATPFTLPIGSYGVALEIAPVTTFDPALPTPPFTPPCALHPDLVYHPSAPGVSTVASDQIMQFSNHAMMSEAWVTMAPANIKNVVDIHYTIRANAAWYSPFGSGCYDGPQAFYETFGPNAPFTLAGRSFQLQPAASQYIVAPTANGIVAPISTALQNPTGGDLGGDSRTNPLPLPFTFPYPGGSTSQIVVTYNGTVFLDPPNTGGQRGNFEAFGAAGFLHGPAMFAPLWSDHEWGNPVPPALPGTVHLDIAPTGTAAYITWWNVEEWLNPGFPYTFQLVLHASGAVEFRYDNRCGTVGDHALVGWTPGWDAHDPGSISLATAMPFITGDGAVPPALTMDARPVLGTAPKLVASDLPPGATGFALIGLAPMTPALDLTVLGMPGCFELVDPLFAATLTPSATTVADLPLGIPNNTGLVGARLYAQSVATSPGSNALGVTVSNALCIRLGLR